MKIMKKSLSIILTILMLISIMSVGITQSSAATNVFVENDIVYLDGGGSNLWNQDGAWFAAYFFNSNDEKKSTFVEMTKAKKSETTYEDNIYQAVVPAGNWKNVLFVRMNKTATTPSFDENEMWNQTSDLCYDGANNLYTINGWDSSKGSWSERHDYTCFNLFLVDKSSGEVVNTAYLFDDPGKYSYTELSKTIDLDAYSGYEFKVNYHDKWYGNNATINDTTTSTSTSGWSLKENENNCVLNASGGKYTFTYYTNSGKIVITTPIDREAKLKNYIEDLNDTGVPSITLADDIALENELAINKDEMNLDVTINGGEYTISGSDINSSSTLTLNGGTYNSTVNVIDDTLTVDGSATLDKVVLTNGANLTVAKDSTIKTLSVETLDALDNVTNNGTIENIVVELEEDTIVDSEVTAGALKVTGEGKTLTIKKGTYDSVVLLDNVSFVVDGANVNKVVIDPLNNNEITGYNGTICDKEDKKVIVVEDDGNNFKLNRKYYYHSEIIGVQTRYQTDMRFIAAIDTDELMNAEDYGFVLIKSTKSYADLIGAMLMTNGLVSEKEMGRFNHYTCKGTDNIVAGDYGKYKPETSYKYVTAAVTGIEETDKDKVIVAMFYIKDSEGNYTYSNYYSSDSNIYNGIAASYNDAAGVLRPTV